MENTSIETLKSIQELESEAELLEELEEVTAKLKDLIKQHIVLGFQRSFDTFAWSIDFSAHVEEFNELTDKLQRPKTIRMIHPIKKDERVYEFYVWQKLDNENFTDWHYREVK